MCEHEAYVISVMLKQDMMQKCCVPAYWRADRHPLMPQAIRNTNQDPKDYALPPPQPNVKVTPKGQPLGAICHPPDHAVADADMLHLGGNISLHKPLYDAVPDFNNNSTKQKAHTHALWLKVCSLAQVRHSAWFRAVYRACTSALYHAVAI
jgi:hypothetical protein